MGDFPRPFSGNKTKKPNNLIEDFNTSPKQFGDAIFEAGLAGLKAGKEMGGLIDDRLVIKEAPSERTKEMGGPNMISTGMAGVDPMTGMPQANQFAPSPINPNVLGPMQSQVTSIAGQQIPGSYNRAMPQAGFPAPFNKYKK